MQTVMTARTPAQRRDAVQLSNASGPVRRALNFRAEGITGTIVAKLNRPALEVAVRDALAVLRVRKVRVSVVDTDYGTAIWVAPDNMNQANKIEFVMRQLGFRTPNGFHWLLTDDMRSEGFWL